MRNLIIINKTKCNNNNNNDGSNNKKIILRLKLEKKIFFLSDLI